MTLKTTTLRAISLHHSLTFTLSWICLLAGLAACEKAEVNANNGQPASTADTQAKVLGVEQITKWTQIQDGFRAIREGVLENGKPYRLVPRTVTVNGKSVVVSDTVKLAPAKWTLTEFVAKVGSTKKYKVNVPNDKLKGKLAYFSLLPEEWYVSNGTANLASSETNLDAAANVTNEQIAFVLYQMTLGSEFVFPTSGFPVWASKEDIAPKTCAIVVLRTDLGQWNVAYATYTSRDANGNPLVDGLKATHRIYWAAAIKE